MRDSYQIFGHKNVLTMDKKGEWKYSSSRNFINSKQKIEIDRK
jgi:hypothetical protein